jgi:carbon-monoxide dehydrogenase medium subunit
MRVLTPRSRSELIDGLRYMTPDSRILAGGTDLVIGLRKGTVRPDMLLDLSGVKDLDHIREESGWVVIGAGVPFARIARNRLIHRHGRCLAEAALSIGSVQIRNRATLPGNIATASPAGDSLPSLLALEARVGVLDSRGQVRVAPLNEVLAGPYQTTLLHDEMIEDVRFPIPTRPRSCAFVKLGSRGTVTIARLSLALVVEHDQETNRIDYARVAMGAVGKTAFRAPGVEERMIGRSPGPDMYADVAQRLSIEVDTSIPGRSSLPYKRVAITGLARRAMERLFEMGEAR